MTYALTITCTQVAAVLGISRQAFHQRIKRGTLPKDFPKPCICTPGGKKRAGRMLYIKKDIQDWLFLQEQNKMQLKEQRKQRQREYKREYNRALYLASKAAGVCVGCHVRDAMPGQAYCPACRIKNAVYQAARYRARRAARG